MAEFCSARSNTISPPQWTSLSPPFTVWDISSTQDKRDFIKELEKHLRKGPVSIVVIEGDRS